jgi:hypothetical protein
VDETTTVRSAATTTAEAAGLILLAAGAVGVGMVAWWAGCLLGGALLLGASWLVSR